jgi:hypothetical protein
MLVPPAAATAYPQNALFRCICTTKWCHPCDASGAVSVVRFAQQRLTWCASMECPVMPDSGTTLPVLLSPRSSALPYFHAHSYMPSHLDYPSDDASDAMPSDNGGGGARWSAQRYSGTRLMIPIYRCPHNDARTMPSLRSPPLSTPNAAQPQPLKSKSHSASLFPFSLSHTTTSTASIRCLAPPLTILLTVPQFHLMIRIWFWCFSVWVLWFGASGSCRSVVPCLWTCTFRVPPCTCSCTSNPQTAWLWLAPLRAPPREHDGLLKY